MPGALTLPLKVEKSRKCFCDSGRVGSSYVFQVGKPKTDPEILPILHLNNRLINSLFTALKGEMSFSWRLNGQVCGTKSNRQQGFWARQM